jgi:hypothetical protein
MDRRRAVAPGLIFIVVGVWALLWSLGLQWARMDRMWPLIVSAVGLWWLVSALQREPRDVGRLWFGCVVTLGGGLLLYITLGAAEWGDWVALWPAMAVIAGVAWVVAWVADMRIVSSLLLGIGALVAGVLGFLVRGGLLNIQSVAQVGAYWPVLLILLGAGFIVQFVLQRH